MKKIFLFCVLSVLSLTSCYRLEKYKEDPVANVEHVKIVTEGVSGVKCVLVDVVKVNYSGHSYILFNGASSRCGVVHDPDCSCHGNE